MSQKNQFIYLIRPVRTGFLQEMTPDEERIMGAHFLHLKELTEKKVAILAGPCLDRAFGVCIFEAESEEAARRMMESDPAVREGIMRAELHPFRVSLMRKND